MANNTVSYGFIGQEHLFSTRIAEVGTERIFDMVRMSAEAHSRVAMDMMGAFVERTTVAQEQIELPGDGTLQPLDEWGNPLPVAPSGSYQVAYPIQGGGTAWGNNRVTTSWPSGCCPTWTSPTRASSTMRLS